jgi:1-phosphofructokinase
MIVTVTLNPALDRTLTVPSITFNEMIRATATRLDWGGKGFNVARALRAPGQDVLATGFVGGATGRMLEQGLNDLDIATDFVHIAGETRTNVVITDQAAETYVKVNETGPQLQPAECAAFLELVQEQVQPQDI